MPTLMIVDDEPLIRSGMIKMIERVASEWQVSSEANDGKEAAAYILHDKVDLIISDIKMPNMDGIDLMEVLSTSGQSIPVIILTGYGEFHYAREALRFNAFDFLLKPIDEDQLRQVLNRFIRERYVPVGMSLNNIAQHHLEKLEFELASALENRDIRTVTAILTDRCLHLADSIPPTIVVNHVIRIINNHLMKKGVVGLEYLPKVVPDKIGCHLATVATATRELLERIASRELPDGDRVIDRAQTFMKQNIEQPLTLAKVAEHVHFNPTYFSEYFRSKTGESFSQYLIRLRINEAKSRLRNPAAKINEIAEQLGYRDPRYFSKLFKLMVGMTPKDYRAKHL